MGKLGKITSYNEEFKGVMDSDRGNYIVPQTIVGEVVDLEIEKNIVKRFKLVEASSKRVKPLCSVFHLCGGCDLQHMSYDEQKRIKTEKIKELFKPFNNRSFNVEDCIGMKDPFLYRSKNQVVFKNDPRKRIVSGFYQENSHDVIDIDKCYIQDNITNKIIKVIKELAVKMRLTAYDEDKKTGLIRHVMIKRSFVTNETMVIIVTPSEMFPGRSNFVKALTAQVREITTIIQNINPRQTSIVLGDKELVLYGKGYIVDVLCGLKFKISSKSFYQVNPTQTEVLYQTAIEKAGLSKTDVLIDAYSGVGTIGLIASKYVKEVISVELEKSAHLDAIGNAKANGINNVKFFNDDASNFIINYVNKKAKVDVLVMDPPRKGSDIKFLNAVSKLAPAKIIYISCNPYTLVDDLKHLMPLYDIKHVIPVDMFPQTYHVETIVVLFRK